MNIKWKSIQSLKLKLITTKTNKYITFVVKTMYICFLISNQKRTYFTIWLKYKSQQNKHIASSFFQIMNDNIFILPITSQSPRNSTQPNHRYTTQKIINAHFPKRFALIEFAQFHSVFHTQTAQKYKLIPKGSGGLIEAILPHARIQYSTTWFCTYRA